MKPLVLTWLKSDYLIPLGGGVVGQGVVSVWGRGLCLCETGRDREERLKWFFLVHISLPVLKCRMFPYEHTSGIFVLFHKSSQIV